ncbi:MAG: ATP-dependent DNA helicase, partial [Betaproteobacteria bacterium]|nr:ATP-dependent DNA helicase [Betaproteobacteria bacterium]
CQQRLELARSEAALPDRASVAALARVERWALTTRTGDLAEVTGLDERSPVIPWITSTRDNCLGSDCPQFRACHVNQARREALAADVVVINHHLFFADLAVRESGMAELLPSVRVVIFDEAHQLNEIGVQFLGVQVGSSQLLDLTRDMLAAGLQSARGLQPWQALAADIERGVRELRLAAGHTELRGGASVRLRWVDAVPEEVQALRWQDAMNMLADALAAAAGALSTVSELSPDFVRLQARCTAMRDAVTDFGTQVKPDRVRWLDLAQQWRMVESPLDIADTVRERLLRAEVDTAATKADAEAPPTAVARPRAWIFTSATLGDDPSLRWFTEPCGLQDATILRVDSPFDYAQQAALYVPQPFARPSDPGHTDAVARLALRGALQLQGRTMVLTTTLRALRGIGDWLARELDGQLDVLVQGQWPKRRLIERFREGSSHGQRGCVLVASASFWEGVDVPGEALQLVIIDKLPFPPPHDPLVQARSNRLEQQGRSAFGDYSVPEAAVALKQGAGRLIRSETDRGVLVVCDPRLATMAYGRRLLAALPSMRRIQTPQDFDAALAALVPTRTSTTAG